MQICKIQYATANAAENMALDAAILALSDQSGSILWRLYGWNEPAMTFGYGQQWSAVKAYIPGFEGTCVRRMTGGGVVDHRKDLTYAVALPSCHSLYRAPAIELYRDLHQRIAEILLDLGFSADLQPCEKACDASSQNLVSGICFTSAEPFDVINITSGLKLAGAAMKRNRSGILIQGSLSMQGLADMSKEIFERKFSTALARWLKADQAVFKGNFPVELLLTEKEKYASPEWNQKR